MRIAVIAPSPTPFVLGGAEHMTLGLQRFINEETRHVCELIKVPTLEDSLLSILKSYEMFSKIDLSSFDKVISTKYPAWMVLHPYHVVYKMHALRGLYDTYHFARKPIELQADTANMRGLLLAMNETLDRRAQGNEALCEFFELIYENIRSGAFTSEITEFPGAFSRRAVHFLDEFAMHPTRIAKYAAISQNVRSRKDYFPNSVSVEVIYHPPRIDRFRTGRDDHLFTVSRLDGPKRIGLLISAMKLVKADIPLYIGGSGPDEARLKELAADDPRIRFLGHMVDAEIIDMYANALAVPYIPYDEDYGLITIEAMKSGKAVVTTKDAGGVNEFVRHGETGLSVEPDERAIAEAIDFLCSNRQLAQTMGKNAARLVESINWRSVVERLLNENLSASDGSVAHKTSKDTPRPKLVIAVTFPIYPPRGGGQTRIYYLYKELAKRFDITAVTLTGINQPEFRDEIAKGFREIRIPKSSAHQALEDQFSSSVDWIPVTDIVASVGVDLSPMYVAALQEACQDADIVVASHPFLAATLRKIAPDVPLWLEAHNVEISLKEQMLKQQPGSAELLKIVEEHERFAWQESKLVFGCTQVDLDALTHRYGATDAEIIVVPNGYDAETAKFTGFPLKAQMQKVVGLDSGPVVVFMGSWHGPNLDAVERIFEYGRALPSVNFLILGSAGLKFSSDPHPRNVMLLGVVDDSEKLILLSSANLAINPMTSGSGSNLKMLDYFASGVPTITTPFGARGLEVASNTHCLFSEINDFQFEIERFFIEERNHLEMCKKAAELAKTKYSWSTIASEAYSKICSLGFVAE